MAEIKFKGFVQKHEGNRPWEISEAHRKQDADGKWFTESTTYHKVWLPSREDSLPVDALVAVVGRQSTPPKKGEYKSTPVVHADTITDRDGNSLVSEGRSKQAAPAKGEPWAAAPAADTAAAAFPAPDLWNAPGGFSDDTPF